MEIRIRDIGLVGYARAHQMQLQCVEQQLGGVDEREHILITEHPPVYTLGKSGNLTSLIKSEEEIADAGIEIVRTERGGDITYHGPGQLVVYPIVNLRRRGLSVAGFIHILEELMVNTAADFGVSGVRDGRNRGVWVGDNKIGSVGIRVRHGVSFHGLAINVNLSLTPFSWIRPCGLFGVGVTSIEKELGRPVSLEKVRESMRKHIALLLSGKENMS
jgi:lipoate-protein ligase B